MKFGIVPINVGDLARPDAMVALARKGEDVGLESVWTFEHVLVPHDYTSQYPYSRSGKMPGGPDTPFLDPLIALAHLAAATSRLRLGTGVNILPQANPLLMAKQVASLDVLSGGRMMLGVGVGWLREEFQAMGAPFERRGARMDDYITAMRKVWRGETVEHRSEFLDWHGFKSLPAPVQQPNLPVVIGGATPPALRRAGRLGDGWFAPTGGAEQLEALLPQVHQAARDAGRDPAAIEISAMWNYAKEGADSVSRYADLGVHRLIVPVQALGADGPAAGLDRLAEEVIAKHG